MTTAKELVRSYADSFAGCTEEEVSRLITECTYVLRLMRHRRETEELILLQQQIDPERVLWNMHGAKL